MKKVCANLDQDSLDTVFEVLVPESKPEPSARGGRRRRRTVKAWVRSHMDQRHRRDGTPPSRADVQLMLGVIGAPLVPQPVEARKAIAIKAEPIEVAKAKYIVEQYVAAAGGEPALSAATSMHAVGKVRMRTTKAHKAKTGMGVVNGGSEVAGGFVVWQMKPEMWCVDMVVSGGRKMSAGSDGKVAWRQAPWQQAHASRGPPRPLRRCVQGLDPKSTANLFSTAMWVGDKCIDGDDCFVLRVNADRKVLRARSSADVEVVRHAMWGYFSQRTGLLVRLEDNHLLRIRRVQGGEAAETAYWETSMESTIGDYRHVDGVNVAHAGRTVVALSRFGGSDAEDGSDADAHGKRTYTCMEETWSIEEVDFNIMGLSNECFLPPRDMVPACNSKPIEKEHVAVDHGTKKHAAAVPAKIAVGGCDTGVRPAAPRKALIVPVTTGLGWFVPTKVVAVETVDVAAE